METLGKRIKAFREYKDLKQVPFGKRCGINQQTISNWENNNVQIDTVNLKKLSKAFPELNTDWLISGEGQMLKSQPDKKDSPPTIDYKEENEKLKKELAELKEVQSKYIKLLEDSYRRAVPPLGA